MYHSQAEQTKKDSPAAAGAAVAALAAAAVVSAAAVPVAAAVAGPPPDQHLPSPNICFPNGAVNASRSHNSMLWVCRDPKRGGPVGPQ